ncbi:sce7726 family protein [Achromobacter ruhlandii]|uniref:sce7726 family protein n=1 Tax=Achromobacter ruhlandii TaxID=72557 RepID=UPI001EEEA2D5|nr:sce7726 family protein [Achromobacter ruhlandii]MCZ8399051.1 sce7726 family protein [Achromobacter ruhlandii]
MNHPLTESEIRHRLRQQLARRLVTPSTMAIEEFGIEGGSSRVDMVVVSKTLDAFEIKSDLDNFLRLRNQIHAYNRVFDTITLVLGPSHVEAACELMPSWWGIARVDRGQRNRLTYTNVRKASQNPRQDLQSLAALLWKDEAVATLAARNQLPPGVGRATRAEIQSTLAAGLSLSDLRASVVTHLLQRPTTEARVP